MSSLIEKFSEGGHYYYEPLKKNVIKEIDGYDSGWDRMFEDTNTFGKARYFSVIFSDMVKRDKKIPTYYEYINEALLEIESNWKKDLDQPYKVELVRERAGRSYASFIIEKQVEMFYKKNFTDAKVWCHKAVDTKFGVDVVFTTKEKKNIYIHITKNNMGSMRALDKKARRINASFSRANGHLVLFYDVREDRKTVMAGNQPLLREEYLTSVIEGMMQSKHYENFDDCNSPKQLLRVLPYLRKVFSNI